MVIAKLKERWMQKKSRQIVCAVWGLSNHAKSEIIPGLKKTGLYRLKWVGGSNEERAVLFRKRFKFQMHTTQFSEILEDTDVRAVFIITKNRMHAPLSLQALRAGKAVFVEKPMVLTYEECREIAKEVERSNQAFTVGISRRFSPVLRFVKEHIARRTSPATVIYRFNQPKNKYFWADEEGGMITHMFAHYVDVPSWLLDEKPKIVYAESSSNEQKKEIQSKNVVATIKFSGGSIAAIVYTTDGDTSFEREVIDVFCEGKVVRMKNFKDVEIYDSGKIKRLSFSQDKGLRNQLTEFARKIKGERSEVISIEDCISSAVFPFKVVESIRMNNAVSLDWQKSNKK